MRIWLWRDGNNREKRASKEAQAVFSMENKLRKKSKNKAVEKLGLAMARMARGEVCI